jgi:hypothetical protein
MIPPMATAEPERFVKEAIRLPDGRRLVYYSFPEPPPRAEAPPPAPPRLPGER